MPARKDPVPGRQHLLFPLSFHLVVPTGFVSFFLSFRTHAIASLQKFDIWPPVGYYFFGEKISPAFFTVLMNEITLRPTLR